MSKITVETNNYSLSFPLPSAPFSKEIIEFLLEKNRITKESEIFLIKEDKFYSLKPFRVVKTENDLQFYGKIDNETIIFGPQNIYKIDGCSMNEVLQVFYLNEDGTLKKDVKRKRGKKPNLKNITKTKKETLS